MPKALVGCKVRVLSMEFLVSRSDKGQLIMRNTRTKKEHTISTQELFAYLADPGLSHVIKLED